MERKHGRHERCARSTAQEIYYEHCPPVVAHWPTAETSSRRYAAGGKYNILLRIGRAGGRAKQRAEHAIKSCNTNMRKRVIRAEWIAPSLVEQLHVSKPVVYVTSASSGSIANAVVLEDMAKDSRKIKRRD